MGDICRKPRPLLVLGAEAPGAADSERHGPRFSRAYYETLPDRVKRHLTCQVVDALGSIVQARSIQGLVMGEA